LRVHHDHAHLCRGRCRRGRVRPAAAKERGGQRGEQRAPMARPPWRAHMPWP
jgi:hypothetical protein